MQSTTLGPRRDPLRSPEIVLGACGVLSLAVAALHVGTVYSGLPAHPLFLHVPVTLIPLMAIAGLFLAWRPRLFSRHGLWVGFVTVFTLASLNLTMSAGESLRSQLGLRGSASGRARLISDHAHAADQLRIAFVLFTAVMIVAVALSRHGRGSRIGVGLFDRILAWGHGVGAMRLLRGLLVVLAVASLVTVFRTGDLGAKAVWKSATPVPGLNGRS